MFEYITLQINKKCVSIFKFYLYFNQILFSKKNLTKKKRHRKLTDCSSAFAPFLADNFESFGHLSVYGGPRLHPGNRISLLKNIKEIGCVECGTIAPKPAYRFAWCKRHLYIMFPKSSILPHYRCVVFSKDVLVL